MAANQNKKYNQIIRKCRILYYKFRKSCSTKSPYKTPPFIPLSPTDDAENCLDYIKSIDWALSNSNKIKNIAISGPYGSGKSSVINTYIKHYNKRGNTISKLFSKKKKFLNISLATFKDFTKVENDDENADTNLQRLIELSILQQLFYHEDDNKLPDSRFKKIKKQSTPTLLIISTLSIIWLIAVLFILSPNFLGKFCIFHYPPQYNGSFRILASGYILLGLLGILYKSSRSLIGASIKKLNIKSAEIEIDKEISKSILNNHLDEIIYFFEATGYNVVVIEDLDRFKQSEIFTKLREINLLINNSRKIKDEVVFIYAIGDDMFEDKDRAKFFDFMIPIIPVINFSNSGEKIRGIVKANKYDINEDLIDDLSLFIDDMRLLHNIMNEFYIYSKKVGSNLIQDKLLAMIVYKNIFPNDFIKLSQNEGELYNVIAKKRTYIQDEVRNLEDKISKQNERLRLVQEQIPKNRMEIKLIYFFYILKEINSTHWLTSINNNNNSVSIIEYLGSDDFDFYANTISYFYNDSTYYRNTHSYNATKIENKINPELTFAERMEEAEQSELSNKIKKTIAEYKTQKDNLQKSKLKDLLSSRRIETEGKNDKQTKLIAILLRNGYIDENYLDYISIFHEGALTKSDYQFLINVKIDKSSSYDFKLNKIEELVKKINEYAFEHDSILNYDLLDYLLQSENHTIKKEKLFVQLSSESEQSFDFIDKYVENTSYNHLFIPALCNQWDGIWNFIQSSNLETQRKDHYFRLIIKHAEIDVICRIFKPHTKDLNNYSDFLNTTDEDTKIQELITKLNLKFKTLVTESPSELLSFVYKNNHYAINEVMLKQVMEFFQIYHKEGFESKNYTSIIQSKNSRLIAYIKSELSKYVDNILLLLETNDSEKIESLLELLNSEALSIDQKEKLIVQTKTIVEDLNKIHDNNVCNRLLKHDKVAPTWENILCSYNNEEEVINVELTDYLNTIDNAEKLSLNKMPKTKVENKYVFHKLCTTILNYKFLNNESYHLLSKSSPWWYESFETENLSINKINILIKNSRINPTIKAYNYLKSNFNGTNITLLETSISNLKEQIGELSFDAEDIRLILKTTISKETISTILANTPNETILEKQESASILLEDLIASKQISDIDDLIPELITDKRLNVDKRIILFTNYNRSTISDVNNVINSFGGIYPDIIDSEKRALIPNTSINKNLLEKLKTLGAISSYKEKEDKGLRVYHSTK